MNVRNDELADLLIEQASDGLSESDEQRLRELLEREGIEENDAFELAMAAACNAIALEEALPGGSSLPASLQAKLAADADRFFTTEAKTRVVTDIQSARPRRAADRKPGLFDSGRIGWAVAAMLAIAILFTGQFGPDSGSPETDVLSARSELISADPETIVAAWARPDAAEFANVTGDVVWNDARQEGYLRLTGMPANDPARAQYQLWIVDSERDVRPVDGGVFDIPRGAGEVIIPIDAKLAVTRPEAFAITREKPGGVVVSAGPLLVVASPG